MDHFCGKNVSRMYLAFFTLHLLLFKPKPDRNVFVFQRKPCLHLMNRLNSMKHMQHFDACNSNQKGEKEKKKESIQFTTFCNTGNITKPFVLD